MSDLIVCNHPRWHNPLRFDPVEGASNDLNAVLLAQHFNDSLFAPEVSFGLWTASAGTFRPAPVPDVRRHLTTSNPITPLKAERTLHRWTIVQRNTSHRCRGDELAVH
jgi:hypothetical protein